MKTTLKFIFGLLFLVLVSCKKEDDPHIGGFLEANLLNSSITHFDFYCSFLKPIENSDAIIDIKWDTRKEDVYKKYKSQELLPGTYMFFYKIEKRTGKKFDDPELSNLKKETIQIFPDRTVKIKPSFKDEE
ncbi:MAG: hypothetical protein MI739_11095 [Bacteroidales bacterium]|nr:hypothetical protein [Bacteroidales bacterium]